MQGVVVTGARAAVVVTPATDQEARDAAPQDEAAHSAIAPRAETPQPASVVTPWPGVHQPLPQALGQSIRELEHALDLSICLLIQQGSDRPYDNVGEAARSAFFELLKDLPRNRPVGLLIDSPGGYARSAYQIARLLQRHCGGFVAIVPRFAKSAATILSLGADRILMHEHAELGPLDAQIFDPDREAEGSALDEVQALERLHAQALTLVDSTMTLMLQRTTKRVDVLLPTVMNFVAQTTRPLFEKIDAVHFTATSRVLKVAETYATKLLERRCPRQQAEQIASRLVYDYPEHGFVIDSEEAQSLGLQVELFTPQQQVMADVIVAHLDGISAVGRMREERTTHAR